MPHHENKKHKHKHRRRDEEHHSRKRVKNPTPKKKTKPKNKADERQRGERWSEAETAACMLSAIRNRGELKAKIPMGGKSAQQVKDEAYQKVLFDTNAESNTLRVMKEIRDKLSKFPSKSKKKFSVLRGLMRKTGGGAINESKKLKFSEVLSLIYIGEESVSGIPEVAASTVLEGERDKTPPRDEFYSKSVTNPQLRDIKKCQLMAAQFPDKKEKTPSKKKGATPKVEKSSKSSRKRKAPPSNTSSSSSCNGDEMSLYSDEESGGSSSRSSSSSSRSRSTSSSASSGNEVYSTARNSGEGVAEPDDESDVSHISPSQTPTKKSVFGLYRTASAEASLSEPPLDMAYSEGNRSVSEQGSFVVPTSVPGRAADSKGPQAVPQAGSSKPAQSTPKEKPRPKVTPPVLPRVDCCEKLHDSLQTLTTELVTNMRETRDQSERTTQAVENFVRSQLNIAQAFRDMADVLVGARYKEPAQPQPNTQQQNTANAQQPSQSPRESGVPQDKSQPTSSSQQGPQFNTAPTHTEETAQEPSPPKETEDEAAAKQEAADIERAIERSLVEARDVQGASFLPITPPIVVSEEEVDDIQRDSPVDSGEAGTSTQNFTAIHSKGNRTDRKDSTSGKRSRDDGKKKSEGRQTRRKKRN